jgi:hypothetical protein
VETLIEVSETTSQRLAKLAKLLSVNKQQSRSMLSTMSKQSNSMADIVWESVFSTELKHADIAVHGAIAVLESDTGFFSGCAMGATALDISAPGRTYRCRVRVGKKGEYSIYLGITLQNIARADKF